MEGREGAHKAVRVQSNRKGVGIEFETDAIEVAKGGCGSAKSKEPCLVLLLQPY